MEKSNKLCLLTTIIFFCLVCCKSSAARPLNDLNPRNLDVTEPEFNVFVPVKEEIGAVSTTLASEGLAFHDRPCEKESMKSQSPGIGKLGGIYGSLVMNVLPKGRTPASGPSRRSNDINV